MRISAVVPVHNSSDELRQCLRALTSSTRCPDEIIVVDDASTENVALVVEEFACSTVRLLRTVDEANSKPLGPAFARNCGARHATGDIVWFLDADVCVHADACELIAQTFAQHADVAALFGSYDDAPAAQNLVSGYVNLRHHWTHQHAATEAWTFWSGCGAIRRDVFLRLGGFDEDFARPAIEDIALGRKLRLAGHQVLVCPQIQAKHLKRWSLVSWLRTDIRDRAIPWTRLMLQEKSEVPRDLNLDRKSRASAVTAWLVLVCCFATLFSASKIAPFGFVVALFALMVLNSPLLRFFARRRGAVFSIGAFACHAMYFLYSSAAFGVLFANAKLRVALKNPRHRVLVLLLATLLKGVMWSAIVPPWQAPDEPQHFLYAHEIARQNTTDIASSEQVPRDAWQLAALAPRQLAAAGLPFDFSDRARITQTLRDIDSAALRRQTVRDDRKLVTVPAFTRFHPPAFHWVLARVLIPLDDISIRWRVLAGRWLAVFCGVITVAFAVLVAREIWPHREDLWLLLGTLVAFQPMNAFTQAAITNDAPLIALFTIFLWLFLRVARNGMNAWRGAALGVVVALGLLTKMSFLSAVPLLLALMLWRAWRERRIASRVFKNVYLKSQKACELRVRHSERSEESSANQMLCCVQNDERRLVPASGNFNQHFKPKVATRIFGWLCVFALPILLSGWWYQKTLGGGSARLLQSSFVEQNLEKSRIYTGLGWEGELRQRTLEMPLVVEIAAYVRALISYWGNFGWGVDVRIPSALWIFLAALSITAVFLTARALWRCARRSSTRCRERAHELFATRRERRALWWMGAATLGLLAFYAAVDWRTRAATGGSFGLRGGYYLPAIAAQMAWLLVGTRILLHRFVLSRAVFASLLGGAMIVLNFACLFGVVARRYYGTSSPLAVVEHATVLQPLSSGFLLAVCLTAVISSTLVTFALGLEPSRSRSF